MRTLIIIVVAVIITYYLTKFRGDLLAKAGL